jgi:Kdo2-lipid IVA lauroyltransferase/acyltransferase
MEVLARPFIRFLHRQPLERIRKWGCIFGRLTYLFAHGRRRTAIENLELAYGDTISREEKQRIAHDCFENLILTGLEFAYSPALGPNFTDYVELVDIKNYWEAHQRGKGVLVIVPHMGNWELIGRFFQHYGLTAHAVTRKQRPEWVARLVSVTRKANGLLEIDKRNALRPVLTALKKGETVNILIDQHARKDAIETTFFGKPAMTVGSAALIALRTGCTVVVAASFRRKDHGIGVVISEILETIQSGDREKDIHTNTQRYVDVIERYVRLYPGCWMWMHRRWRT